MEQTLMEKMKMVSIQSTPMGMYTTVKIKGGLGSPEDWEEEIKVLENASPNDIVHLKINCPGGQVDTLTEFLSAMDSCQGHIVGEITGICCSAATFIFLACDEFVVNEYIEWMSHNCWYGTAGTEHNVLARAKFTNTQATKLINDYYSGFFSETEIKEILTGDDKWLTADEVKERLPKRIEYVQNLITDQGEGEDEESYSRASLEKMTKKDIINLLIPEDFDNGKE